MDNTTTTQSSGETSGLIMGLLGIVFVTLKLCGVIDWSWWWVTAPFWGGFALLLAILACVGAVFVGLALYEKGADRRRRRASDQTTEG